MCFLPERGPWSICYDPEWKRNTWGGETHEYRGWLCQACAERLLKGQTFAWMPITTAPRDRIIFAWGPGWDRPRFVCWRLNSRTRTEFWNDAENFDEDHYENETHPPTLWMDLRLRP